MSIVPFSSTGSSSQEDSEAFQAELRRTAAGLMTAVAKLSAAAANTTHDRIEDLITELCRLSATAKQLAARHTLHAEDIDFLSNRANYLLIRSRLVEDEVRRGETGAS